MIIFRYPHIIREKNIYIYLYGILIFASVQYNQCNKGLFLSFSKYSTEKHDGSEALESFIVKHES